MRQPAAVLLATLLALVAVLGAGGAPARAAGGTTVTILGPAGDEAVSGLVTVRFRVEVEPGTTSQTAYRVRMGRWFGDLVQSSCWATCDYSVVVDTTASRFPDYRFAWTDGQVDDGRQQLRVDSYSAGSNLLATATSEVVVDNDRPTLTVSGPVAPSGADGRPTVDGRLRLEVQPVAHAAGTTVTDVRLGSSLTLLGTATPPASPGAPWVLDVDTSGWSEGPRSLDVVAKDSRGLVSAMVPFDVMVIHSMGLGAPTLPSPVFDDDLASLALHFSYSQFVKDTWPVQVDTLVDGTLSNRQGVPSNDRTNFIKRFNTDIYLI